MQMGSLTQAERQRGCPVWEYRWREPGPNGKRIHRRMLVCSVEQYASRDEAMRAVSTLQQEINALQPRLKFRPVTFSELVTHYRQRELGTSGWWKSNATKKTYEGYIAKWITPRWG
ncbi:MAG: hypothetical protein WA634_20595 [Silvibacterium sp.]